MKKLMLLMLCVLVYAKPILMIDSKGHRGIIRDIIVTKDKDIISASDDKTIRVWDSNTLKEKRKILGQIGAGNDGKIFAIALSKDEKYFAVGGYLGNDIIRIYDYHSGKLIKLLKSHNGVINDLYFSDKYLISGSADKTAKIWDKNFNLVDTIKFHTEEVYAVGIFKNNNKYFAVTAGYDNQIEIYDIKHRYVIKSYKFPYKLQYLAINKQLHQIAVAGYSSKNITIFDYNLNKIKTIYNNTQTLGLKYSLNGKYLIVGASSYPDNVNIYKTYNYTLYNSFKKHTNLVMAVNFLDNYTAISGGGNNNEIYIWDINSLKNKKIVGVGNIIWSVGINGNKIAWGNKWTKSLGKSELETSINLNNFNISNNSYNFKRISSVNGEYSLKHSKGGNYGYSDAVLNIYKNGYLISKIVRNSYDGYSHRCYGWYKNYIISGGSNGHLTIYNINGEKVVNLVGHTGEVWSIAVDGDTLVSGSYDQTIKLWDLSKLDELGRYNSVLKPYLNLFITKNNDYIAWSNKGYYVSSINGDKYVGYWINQGYNKEAKFVPSSRYFKTYYRPDIISNLIKTKDIDKAIMFANQTKKVKKVDVSNQLPPFLTLLTPSHITTQNDTITIKYLVESKSPITKTIIYQNGELITKRGLKIKKQKGVRSITINLKDGENIISIRAKNRYAMSDELLVYVTKKGKKIANIYKPNLYLLAVGVSNYKNPEYNLEFADKDAFGIAKVFKSQEGKIYNKVITKVLTNKQATKDNILDGLDWIYDQATQKDVIVIFFAGHGINDDRSNYYYMAYNSNIDRLRRTAVRWSDIQDTISDLPSKVLLLADTCHSGNITGSKRRDITGAIKSILNSGSGAIIMTATTGSGYSYEEPKWGHGAFTKALMEGIKGKADFDNDRTISIKELDLFITNEVKKLTNGKQKPTTIVPNSIPDFAVGVK